FGSSPLPGSEHAAAWDKRRSILIAPPVVAQRARQQVGGRDTPARASPPAARQVAKRLECAQLAGAVAWSSPADPRKAIGVVIRPESGSKLPHSIRWRVAKHPFEKPAR